MRRPRISIARMMASIALFSVAIAFLSRPTRFAAAIIFGATVTTLAAATIRWLGVRGSARDYWRGFCIAGWIGFAIHFGPFSSFQGHGHPDTTPLDGPSLFVIDEVHELGQRVGVIHEPFAEMDQATFELPSRLPVWADTPRTKLYKHWFDSKWATEWPTSQNIFGAGQHPCFIQIGYSLICVFLAIVGGWYDRRVGLERI